MLNQTTVEKDSPFLSVRDLVVEYTSEGEIVHAVNGVSFDVRKGSTLALVGETGAGKTSIAKAILRVLPDVSARVRSGEIVLDGDDLLRMNEDRMNKVRGRKVSMVFQDPMTALNPTMRVGAQIAEVIQAHDSIGPKEARERAMAMLEMVGIPRERFREYTRALISAIPSTDINHAHQREILQGEIVSPINPKPGCRFAARCKYACERCGQPQLLEELSTDHFVACCRAREISG